MLKYLYMRRILVVGIGTEIGKTVICSVLVEALQADYWKPVQCGDLENSDTQIVKSLISNRESVFHQEAYRLKGYKSPHAAAEEEDIEIDFGNLIIPKTNKTLIIEPPGGLMVPLNSKDLVIDMIPLFEAEVVLVSQNYLGSINHTLLTAEALASRGHDVIGIIFNGVPNKETEEVILKITALPMLGSILMGKTVDREFVKKYAPEFKSL